MPAKEQEILNQVIKDLPFTEDFRSFSQKNGLIKVGEIVEIPIAELLKLDGFTYHSLQELVQFLEKNDLAHLLKQ